MITEKQLLKWGFVNFDYSNALLYVYDGNSIWFYPKSQKLMIFTDGGDSIDLSYCHTKRKADQALRLFGLPSIDKLNAIKNEAT